MLDLARRSAKNFLSRTPRTYRPGSLLRHLQSDLAGFDFELIESTRAVVRTDDARFEVREIVEPQFLMHVVSAEFSCEFPSPAPLPAMLISARHQGAWKRTGVTFTCVAGEGRALTMRLNECAPLQQALLGLDFTDWRLRGGDTGWKVTMKHFGASEVVGQIPTFRRYIRFEKTQRRAFVTSLQALAAVLR
jgi:hypothetical protein